MPAEIITRKFDPQEESLFGVGESGFTPGIPQPYIIRYREIDPDEINPYETAITLRSHGVESSAPHLRASRGSGSLLRPLHGH